MIFKTNQQRVFKRQKKQNKLELTSSGKARSASAQRESALARNITLPSSLRMDEKPPTQDVFFHRLCNCALTPPLVRRRRSCESLRLRGGRALRRERPSHGRGARRETGTERLQL